MRREPGMPRKPLSAYIFFSQEAREKYKSENPKLQNGNIMKEISNRWSAMSKEERELYTTAAKEDKARYEKELFKIKNKRSKNMENPREKDSIDDNVSLPGEHPDFIPGNKDLVPTFNSNEDSNSNINMSKSQPIKVETQKSYADFNETPQNILNRPSSSKEIFPSKASSPPQDGPIRFNLPEARPSGFTQTSPSPLPIRKDISFMSNNNNYNYQDTNSGSQEVNNNPGSFVQRSNLFSPAPFAPNRSPGVSPNIVPMLSPMMRNPDNFRDYSSRQPSNLTRNPTVMGQSSSATPVNKNDMPYPDYYNINQSPSGYTPIRQNLRNYNPMYSPATTMENQGLFGPSPNINNMGYQTPFSYQRTPGNQFSSNRQVFMTPKPVNQSVDRSGEGNKKQGGDQQDLFAMNPF